MALTQQDIDNFTRIIFNIPHINGLTQEHIQFHLFPERDYQIIGVYGTGVSAVVLNVNQTGTQENFAVKVVRLNDEIRNQILREIYIQNLFSNYNMSPKIINSQEGLFDKTFPLYKIVMDTINKTLHSYILENIRNLGNLKKMYKPLECLLIKKYILHYNEGVGPILHGDMITNNIAILNDKQTLGFIDFGWSFSKPKILQLLDCICLVNALKGYNTRETQDFAKYIIKLYNKMFNVKLEYDNFIQVEVLNYAYSTNIPTNRYLHSYRIPNYVIENNPTLKGVKSFIRPEDLIQVFPEITPPTVDNV